MFFGELRQADLVGYALVLISIRAPNRDGNNGNSAVIDCRSRRLAAFDKTASLPITLNIENCTTVVV